MPIRITGLNSGLDTESIISALVSSYNYKTNKYKKAQTKLSWKQDAWKSLNTKIYSLYKNVGNMKFSTAYNLKSTTVSDSTKVTVSAGSGSANGSYSIQVISLAKTGYLTGGQLSSGTTSSTTLESLGYTGGTGTISLTTGGTKTDISVTKDSTIQDVVNQLKSAGVSANYDETNRRIYVSSKDSGADNDFSLAGSDTNGTEVLKALGLNVKSDATTAEYKDLASYANLTADQIKQISQNKTDAQTSNTELTKQNAYYQNAIAYAKAASSIKTVGEGKDADDFTLLKSLASIDTTGKYVDADGNIYTKDSETGKYTTSKSLTGGTYDSTLDKYTDADGNELTGGTYDPDLNIYYVKTEVDASVVEAENSGYTAATDKLNSLAEDFGLIEDKTDDNGNVTKDSSALTTFKQNLTAVKSIAEEAELNGAEEQQMLQNIESALSNGSVTVDGNAMTLDDLTASYQSAVSANNTTITANNATIAANSRITAGMTDDEVSTLMSQAAYAAEQLAKSDADMGYSSGATRVDGQDSEIYVNGAKYTGTSNTFSINGLTITATGVTGTSYDATETNAVSATVNTDTQGIYDKVKDFLTQYNALINEMTSLYNADSAKGYDPLTSEEKDAMSDSEVELWESKIKASLLRRDDTLSSLISSMTTAMSKSVQINGKSYSLSSFGIKTLGYFNAAENEQNAYHIDGDEDDSATSGNTDKLMAAIASDPDSVVEFMQQMSTNLYNAIDAKMKTSSLSSVYTVYNDKEMASEYSDYTDLIKKWEDKLQDQEDYYYKKFSAMETALAKLNSSSSALTGLLGS